MSNAPLNSVHLRALPRRAEYRRAREAVLRARGAETLAAENKAQLERPERHTRVDCANLDSGYVLRDGPTVHFLKVGLNVIGRFSDSDVIVPEQYISRRHCALVVHAASGCELYDLASKNGTQLNGQRLTHPVWLVSGDQITLCDRQFVFLSATDCAANSAASDDVTRAD